MNFSDAKVKFDAEHAHVARFAKSLVPVDGKYLDSIPIKDSFLRDFKEFINSKRK